jgi:hypothetical protein
LKFKENRIMPWSNNHLPKYRKHRASGQAVVTLNGRDFYLGPHGTNASKLEYDRLLGEWLASGRNPLVHGDDCLTVVELCARYYRFAKTYYVKDGRCTKVLSGRQNGQFVNCHVRGSLSPSRSCQSWSSNHEVW